jgi:zinc protease
MLKEGSGDLSSDQYKAAYSKVSSDFDVNIDKESVHFQSSGLSKYESEITNLFLDTLFKPQFMNPKKASQSIREYDKVRKQRQAQIAKSFEEAGYFASISFGAQLFGTKTYGTPEWGTSQGVKLTLLSDVQKFYKENLWPENLQFALSGNYSNEVKASLLNQLKSLKPKAVKDEQTQSTLAADQTILKSKIIVVDKPGLKQAEVRMGHYGPLRTDKDFIPLYVANSVVGSGDFSSQLMQEIRVKRGLVYGINSSFLGHKNAGGFIVSSSTRFEKVPELITTTLDILKSVTEKGLDPQALEIQKGILLGQFPLKFETDHSFLYQLMKYNTYGFEKTYIKDFFGQIKSLNVQDANRVLKTFYKPEQIVILVYAPKSKLPKELKDLKLNIEYIDYRKVF